MASAPAAAASPFLASRPSFPLAGADPTAAVPPSPLYAVVSAEHHAAAPSIAGVHAGMHGALHARPWPSPSIAGVHAGMHGAGVQAGMHGALHARAWQNPSIADVHAGVHGAYGIHGVWAAAPSNAWTVYGAPPPAPLAYVTAPPSALSDQSVITPPPAPTLPGDPLLSCGAYGALPASTHGAPPAPASTHGAPPASTYGVSSVYGSPGYWWGSSVGLHSPAGQQPSPPQLSGGYGFPMASPSSSPALPPAPWDPVLLTAQHAAPVPNNYTGGADWYMDTGAMAHMFAHPGRSNQDGTPPM
ncbi:splicing factor 3A subunit 2-like [Triticum aestivum]|uniref:splicing factor 3A subunit 2-like n=1 Tax=Triticum aestivum TaxID=4565 RepID=UPI001D00440D|nr:splicing factor 3A subunit 2-like [Triticum aestivum]